MKKMAFSAMLSVAAAGLTVVVLAQSQPQTSPQSQQPAGSAQQVTVAGCVQRESDYRRARDAGRGGAAGTGAGVGNEFVLVNASMSTGAPSGTTGTGGTAGGGTTGTDYELTGANEGKVAQYVGKRVEITGTLKPAETTGSGRPTGGATAGPPPAGVDVLSKDLKLREIEVSSVREVSGTCPAMR